MSGVVYGRNIATRGITARDPGGGVERASSGYAIALPTELPSEGNPISPDAVDANGAPRLLDGVLLSIQFVDVSRSRFAHPDREFTGYSAAGIWHTDGRADPTHEPFEATWGSEAAGPHRGTSAHFPKRMFVITTRIEVVFLDADTLDVFLRFVKGNTAPVGNGAFLGGSGDRLYQARFEEGFLLVATSSGLRIADFRADTAYLYRVANQTEAAAGLVQRNGATYFDGADISHAHRALLSDELFTVSVGSLAAPEGTEKNTWILGAAAGAGALHGLILHKPGLTYPEVKGTSLEIEVSQAWETLEEPLGGSISQTFSDAGSNWNALRIYPGDRLLLDSGDSVIVLEVAQVVPGSVLKTQPLPAGASGSAYRIRRSVQTLQIGPDGSLVAGCGGNLVLQIPAPAWADRTEPALASGLAFDWPGALLAAPALVITDLAPAPAGGWYVGTDIGVFFAPRFGLGTGLLPYETAEYRYASVEVTGVDVQHRILSGTGTRVDAVVVDPENGNCIVSLTSPSDMSVITQIDPTNHRAVAAYSGQGRVRCLSAFRNPAGPPRVEVS